jgi:hypothetical protein
VPQGRTCFSAAASSREGSVRPNKAELCGTDPFDYLTELQRHVTELARNLSEWMRWNLP